MKCQSDRELNQNGWFAMLPALQKMEKIKTVCRINICKIFLMRNLDFFLFGLSEIITCKYRLSLPKQFRL